MCICRVNSVSLWLTRFIVLYFNILNLCIKYPLPTMHYALYISYTLFPYYFHRDVEAERKVKIQQKMQELKLMQKVSGSVWCV